MVTVLILWCAFASVYALTLGYNRIPYAAALDRNFFRAFARLHPKGRFPNVSLLVIGGLAIAASMLDLETVLKALPTARILVQLVGQIAALLYIRKRRAEFESAGRTWCVPSASRSTLCPPWRP